MYPTLLTELAEGYLRGRDNAFALHDALLEQGCEVSAKVMAEHTVTWESMSKLGIAQELAGHSGPWWYTRGKVASPNWPAIKELRQQFGLTEGYWQEPKPVPQTVTSGQLVNTLTGGLGPDPLYSLPIYRQPDSSYIAVDPAAMQDFEQSLRDMGMVTQPGERGYIVRGQISVNNLDQGWYGESPLRDMYRTLRDLEAMELASIQQSQAGFIRDRSNDTITRRED